MPSSNCCRQQKQIPTSCDSARRNGGCRSDKRRRTCNAQGRSLRLITQSNVLTFLGTRLALLDEIIEASIRCKQHSNAVGALKLQAQLTRLLEGS